MEGFVHDIFYTVRNINLAVPYYNLLASQLQSNFSIVKGKNYLEFQTEFSTDV
jgi:hypothetical protein